MARNMSFSLTTDQIRNRSKTVTRRLGWANLKPGEIVNACVKCMGLKPGEKIERICQIRIVSNEPEVLTDIQDKPDDCAKEGFPNMTPRQFLAMFEKNMRCISYTVVNRIEFEYVDG
jgi:hypothetical protein